MLGYKISESGLEWNLYLSTVGGFCTDGNQYVGYQIAHVLQHVKRIFECIFGKERVNSHNPVAVHYSLDFPQTFRNNQIIFLTSQSRHYLQHIYQFSHELCHLMIDHDVCDEYRWLEETLCQMMSWYVLQKVYDLRDISNVAELEKIYDKIPGYLHDCIANRVDIKGASLAELVQKNFDFLKKNCYVRELNSAIAYEIYPLFCDYPKLWTIVPYMDRLTDGLKLNEALHKICSSAGIEPEFSVQLLRKFIQ